MKKSLRYNKIYYESIRKSTISSAKEMLPVVRQFVSPSSVVDVGCGTGIWLAEWRDAGVNDICGVDGDYINKEQLAIPAENFITANLETTLIINRKFDLVMSLEVAEHLHEEVAPEFVNTLCGLGDIVLFSAAIPGQGGLNHYNEKYPEYWVTLFRNHGYFPYDCLREVIWRNTAIDKCYRQNVIFFANKSGYKRFINPPEISKQPLSIVHPEYFEDKLQEIEHYRKLIKNPLRILKHYLKSLGRRLKRLVN